MTGSQTIEAKYETHFVYVEYGEELGRHAGAYIDFVYKTGRTVVVLENGKPIAQLAPAPDAKPGHLRARRV
jgi:antitoxin (DNA-binding transcriptional repressor) of toxin-antitoxin stability system